jgi:hypothetical protein
MKLARGKSPNRPKTGRGFFNLTLLNSPTIRSRDEVLPASCSYRKINFRGKIEDAGQTKFVIG